MTMTKSEAIAGHRAMWWWIINTSKRLGKKMTENDFMDEYGVKLLGCSFLCDYGYSIEEKPFSECRHCIADWGKVKEGATSCDDIDLFRRFREEQDVYKACEIAEQIRDIPIKGISKDKRDLDYSSIGDDRELKDVLSAFNKVGAKSSSKLLQEIDKIVEQRRQEEQNERSY